MPKKKPQKSSDATSGINKKRRTVLESNAKQIDACEWEPLGEGAFKRVSVTHRRNIPLLDERGEPGSFEGPWVRKKELGLKHDLSGTARQVRLFKEIEPDIPIRVHNSELFMPYYGKRELSDKRRALKCLSIFKKTGRILIDGVVEDNILVKNGQSICIDVDLALRPDSPLSDSGFFSMKENKRKKDMPWYDAPRNYHLITEVDESMPKTYQVLLGLIDLAEYFGEDNVPDNYLCLSFMETLDKIRRAEDKSVKQFLTDYVKENPLDKTTSKDNTIAI